MNDEEKLEYRNRIMRLEQELGIIKKLLKVTRDFFGVQNEVNDITNKQLNEIEERLRKIEDDKK